MKNPTHFIATYRHKDHRGSTFIRRIDWLDESVKTLINCGCKPIAVWKIKERQPFFHVGICLEKEIESNELIEFKLYSNPFWQDDSFSYSGTHCTGGMGGTQTVINASMEDKDIVYDRWLHTPEERIEIEKYINDNFEALCEEFCTEFENQEANYEREI